MQVVVLRVNGGIVVSMEPLQLPYQEVEAGFLHDVDAVHRLEEMGYKNPQVVSAKGHRTEYVQWDKEIWLERKDPS